MKLLACADLHITNQVPRYRKDNYLKSCLDKFDQILYISTKYKAPVLIAGDFFDTHKTPYSVVKRIISIIDKYNTKIFVVPGQHDYEYHNPDLDKTPLGNLLTHKKINLLTHEYNFFPKPGENTTLIGAGWDQEPEEEANILVTHQMITKKGALYPGQKKIEYNTQNQIMKKYPWAYFIISGDNHESFYSCKKEQVLINCGSIMRKRKDQIHHKPCVWLIETESIERPKRIELKVKPTREVFDFDKINRDEIKEENKEQTNEEIDTFINSLDSEKIKPDFIRILSKVIKKIKPNKETEDIINQTIKEGMDS